MKKKGFTLIELLAVIVILAIIAVIATPIIVGIIEDSRKAAFERSVEGIIHATDIDFGTQETLANNSYTVTNGVVDKTLKTPIKNIEGFNGTIKYDEKGNSTYAIHNGKWCMKKTVEGITTEEYVEGECILPIKISGNILDALRNTVPNEDDAVSTGNGQLVNLGDYGIRYQGTNPNNYVEFSGETWRIIGIVDNKVKLIKLESIGQKGWNDVENDGGLYEGVDINNWVNGQLDSDLNYDFYSSLSDKNMIDKSTWHLRGYNTTNGIDKYGMYEIERETGVTLYETPNVERNIGLMYPSDYAFASQTSDTCLNTTDLKNYNLCIGTNWLSGITEWLMTPYSELVDYGDQSSPTIPDDVSLGYEAFYVSSDGIVYSSSRVWYQKNVRPTIYLKDNIKIIGSGDGSENNKYQLAME